ncbi:MAG: hypothetical protein EBX40_07465 [Gammaproteobacteria bacterium]|nr:hypothetical protein [Gammaproteobacteria bacterium]
MSKSTKSDILKKIENKLKKSRELKQKKASGSIVDDYVYEFMRQVEDVTCVHLNHDAWETMVNLAIYSLESRVRVLDQEAKVEIRWHTPENLRPQVSSVLIRWSILYQAKSSSEPESYFDMVGFAISSSSS